MKEDITIVDEILKEYYSFVDHVGRAPEALHMDWRIYRRLLAAPTEVLMAFFNSKLGDEPRLLDTFLANIRIIVGEEILPTCGFFFE